MKRILGAFLVVGLLHRLAFLGQRQLWTEELMQALISRASSARDLLNGLREGMYLPAPLDYFVQKGVVLVLGESEWALRLHAVLFGTLSILFFFRIAHLLFGKRTALYSTFLFLFFPLQYHYSQQGRPAALFLFLTLASYDIVLRWVQGNRRYWSGVLPLCGISVLLLYQSYLGFLVLLSQLTGLLVGARTGPHARADKIPPSRGAHILLFLLSAVVAALAFVPWFRFAWSKPLIADASEIFDLKLFPRIIQELGDGSYVVTVLLLAGVVAGTRALSRHGRRRTLGWLLSWALLSIPAVLIADYWAGYFFSVGQILHTTPALVLLAGYGLSYVGERLTILEDLPYQLSAPAIVYAASMCILAVWIGAAHWTRELADWRGTARFLGRTARAGDAITMPQMWHLLEYYAPGLEPYRVTDLDPGTGLLERGEAQRRIVVCYDGLRPDPCRDFRAAANGDAAWAKTQLRGFTLFARPTPSAKQPGP
jgi:4-amino-4-deoxy-L-arabinose transferase-like glycosyltransferase